MSTRTFVTTDSHGCSKELNEVLDLAKFDFHNDILIHLGDCTDRGPDSFSVVQTLLKVKNLIAIRGNHDEWMLQWIETGQHPSLQHNGVWKTFLSYMEGMNLSYTEANIQYNASGVRMKFEPSQMPESHVEFFKNQISYHIDEQNRLFVHAGYDVMEPIEWQDPSDLMWNRGYARHLGLEYEKDRTSERYEDVNNFKRVFIGHTPTVSFKERTDTLSPLWLPGGIPYEQPMYMRQCVNLDTGCCFGNYLSLIDITDDDNHILYQSSKHIS